MVIAIRTVDEVAPVRCCGSARCSGAVRLHLKRVEGSERVRDMSPDGQEPHGACSMGAPRRS
jgi:hypothetical protein